MVPAHDDQRTAAGRPRRRIRVDLRPSDNSLPADELRRRAQELERLLIKAACRRAARLAQQAAEAKDTATPVL